MSARVTVSLGPDGPIAIKTSTTPDEVARLQDEADRLRRAQHPGVVRLVGWDAGDGRARLRTAYAGEPLSRWRGSARRAAGLVAAVAATLGDLHDRGVVHGRVDASHVLVGADGRPRLCGLSHPGDADPADDVRALAELAIDLADRSRNDDRGLRRWAGRDGAAAALRRVAGQAQDPVRSRRPTARQLRRAVLAAVPDAQPEHDGVPATADGLLPRARSRMPDAQPEHGGAATPTRARPDDDTQPADVVASNADTAEVVVDPAEPGLGGPTPPVSSRSSDAPIRTTRPRTAGRGTGPRLPWHVAASPADQSPTRAAGERPGRPRRPGDAAARPADQSSAPTAGGRSLPRRSGSREGRVRSRRPSLRTLAGAGAAGLVLLLAGAGVLALRAAATSDHQPGAPNGADPDRAHAADGDDRVHREHDADQADRAHRPLPAGATDDAAVTDGTAAAQPDQTGGPRPTPPTDPSCPRANPPAADVDGDGCPSPVTVDGRRIAVEGARFELGEPGDVVAVGNWGCHQPALPALLRPSTGDVFVFRRWAGPSTPVTVGAVQRIAGADGIRAEATAPGCDDLVVERAGDDIRVDVPVEDARP